MIFMSPSTSILHHLLTFVGKRVRQPRQLTLTYHSPCLSLMSLWQCVWHSGIQAFRHYGILARPLASRQLPVYAASLHVGTQSRQNILIEDIHIPYSIFHIYIPYYRESKSSKIRSRRQKVIRRRLHLP